MATRQNRLLAYLPLLLMVNLAHGETRQWDRTFGGSSNDTLVAVQQTTDGGYILGGWSESPSGGDKTQGSRGALDYWIVKADAKGTKLWDRTYGSNNGDWFCDVSQTSDGGYILGGSSAASASGDQSQNSHGGSDYWIVKVDASGTKQWDRIFGGSGWDYMFRLQQTADGGYILGGESSSPAGGDKTQGVQGTQSEVDYWIVKVDTNGVKQWDKTFGGYGADTLMDIQQTSDGGYILGGYSSSSASGDKTQESKGGLDFWVVKVDAVGLKQWDRTYGGSSNDYFSAFQQTADGGYILAGYSASTAGGDKSQGWNGGYDFWIVKVDTNGLKQWDRTIGGTGSDLLRRVRQTRDRGYILGGSTTSPAGGDKTQSLRGGVDYWIVKTDANGVKEWDRDFGGSGLNPMSDCQQTSDGGYIVGGRSDSPVSGDKTEVSRGGFDYWIVKMRNPNGMLLRVQ